MTAKPLPRLTAALSAVQRGWPVFPLHPYSKYPAVRDWERRATCDPDQITRWFMAAPFNIAIACGAARLVVLDLDAARSQPPPEWAEFGVTHGREVLRLLATRAGQPDPVDTYTVATPGVINGGFCLFLLCLQRLMTALICLVDSLLSGGVLQRDTTAVSFLGRWES
ncbi:MAG TPA: bifunctional DNA primase/polymerase [Pseudonocardiaceae bacterium]|nr:bifunctional DNA primase/polymerase [Pseudonocardiaceae bacterium]